MTKKGYVYIMSNETRTVLYTGVTSNLHNRVAEHKSYKGSAFTSKYKCTHLVFYEEHDSIINAIANWKREWKDQLIESINPSYTDLANEW
jgi:putative endonuclease